MRIEVTVAPDGTTRIQAHGFAGRACLDATRRLEEALGHKTADRLTGEFFAKARGAADVTLPVRGHEAG
jgi:hypothetical protein